MAPVGVKDAKAVVVVFLGTECPINNAFMPRLAELHKEYADKGVRSSPSTPTARTRLTRVAAHAKKHDMPFPVLKDAGNVVADQFGAKRTPEAFVLDAERKIRYQRPHRRPVRHRLQPAEADAPRPGRGPRRGPRRQAGDDGDDAVAGLPDRPAAEAARTRPGHLRQGGVAHPAEPLPGVPPSRPDRPDGAADLRRRSPGARRSARWSQERRMPPWHADPRHGKFANDRSLPQEERDTLLAWIDAGLSEGRRQGPAAAEGVRRGLAHRQAGRGLHDADGVHGAGEGTARAACRTSISS